MSHIEGIMAVLNTVQVRQCILSLISHENWAPENEMFG